MKILTKNKLTKTGFYFVTKSFYQISIYRRGRVYEDSNPKVKDLVKF